MIKKPRLGKGKVARLKISLGSFSETYFIDIYFVQISYSSL